MRRTIRCIFFATLFLLVTGGALMASGRAGLALSGSSESRIFLSHSTSVAVRAVSGASMVEFATAIPPADTHKTAMDRKCCGFHLITGTVSNYEPWPDSSGRSGGVTSSVNVRAIVIPHWMSAVLLAMLAGLSAVLWVRKRRRGIEPSP